MKYNIVVDKQKRFLSVKEIAALLGVSKSLIYDKVYREQIPCRRMGRRILIPSTFVDKVFKL